jgi:predicted amidophosphoribosyltransferase
LSSSDAEVTNRCPVCQARFRGARLCSRCGADLEPLMLLAAGAWRLREEARLALEAGKFEGALGLAQQAQQMQRTPTGEFLRALSSWLMFIRVN